MKRSTPIPSDAGGSLAEQPTQSFAPRRPARPVTWRQPGSPTLPPPDLFVPAPAGRRWVGWLLLAAFSLVFLLSAAALGGLYYLVGDFIVPGVQVLGLDLGGQSLDEAAVTLQRDWDARSIAFRGADGAIWVTRPEALGIELDATATARRARQIGRHWEGADSWNHLLTGQRIITPVWHIDLARAEAGLQPAAAEVARPAQDARLTLQDGQLQIRPAQEGRRLDMAAMLDWLAGQSAVAVVTGQGPLFLAPILPRVTEQDLQPHAARLEAWLAVPLVLDLWDPVTDERLSLTVAPVVWSQWFDLRLDDTSGAPVATAAVGRISLYLEGQSAGLGAGRHLAVGEAAAAVGQTLARRLDRPETAAPRLRIYHGDRIHLVRAGESLSSIAYSYGLPYPWIQKANPGASDALQVGQTLIIPSPDALLPLPIVANKRIVVSLAQQRMWAYQDDALVWEWPVSTGIASSPTSPGVFQIQSHESNAYAGIWDLWMPNFMGIYRPAPDIDFLNGFHGFPTRNGSNLLWTGDLGRPVTYGCILLSSQNAATLYDWAEAGVIVEVRP